MQAINVSIGFDRRLWAQDLAGSKAHAAMLVAQGILSAADGALIQGGLDTIRAEIEAGTFPFRDRYEDIHMNVEARLAELIGDPILLAHAHRHYAKMQGMHQVGQVFDRDHTSRAMHEMLERMFAQVDAAKALESGVTIE